MHRLRHLLAGGLLTTFLIACSAPAPNSPGDSAAAQTAGPLADSARTSVPGLEATAASGVGAAATAVPTAIAAAQGAVDQLASLVGQDITLTGPVTQITSGVLFQMNDPAHGEVAVLLPSGNLSIAEGQQVDVSGTVVAFDQAAIEQQLGITLDERVAASLQNGSLFIADTVNPSAASSP